MALLKRFKVIVVDEDMRRQLRIKNMISWRETACEIVAFAQNNKDAYRLYREIRPDIILLGVSGKRLDRIPLIHQIRRMDEHVQILLIMEGYSYYRVRSYVRSGIDDLLLYTLLSKEGLQAAIEEAKVKAHQHKRLHAAVVEGVIRELQQCLLLRKEDHSSDVSDFEQVLQHPYFDFIKAGALLAYFRIDHIHLIHHQRKIDRKYLRSQLERLLNENHLGEPDAVPLFLNQHSAIVLFRSADVTQALFSARSFHLQVTQQLDYQMTVIISDPFTSAQEMMEQFDHLLLCSRNRFYEKESVLVLRETKKPEFQRLQAAGILFHRDLFNAAIAQDFDRVRQIQEEILDYMEEHQILPNDVLSYSSFIVSNVEGREITFRVQTKDFPFEDIGALISNCETLQRLRIEMQQIWNIIETWILEQNKPRYRRDVRDWMEFIHNNIQRPLSLKEVASHFQVSSSYASRLFKQEIGKTMITFITEEKMKEAGVLLHESNLSIKEIAKRVGYEDPFYFDRVFHKYYQMTPREYRRKLEERSI